MKADDRKIQALTFFRDCKGETRSSRRCVRRESFVGQKRCRGKIRFAADGNAMNPRIGSQVQYPGGSVEEQTVGGLRKPRDGTR